MPMVHRDTKVRFYRPSTLKGVDVKMVRTSRPIQNRVLFLTVGVIVFLAGACLATFNEDSLATGGGQGNFSFYLLGMGIALVGLLFALASLISD
jgi:hypothetical protein